jgi:hypothetical protein
MRYINVALVDEEGSTSSTQIMTNDPREAADYMESEMSARNGRGRNKRRLVAAFIFDTDSNTLQHYIIRGGLYAKLVTDKLFD